MTSDTHGAILVVDDNRVNRRVLEVKLSESGYTVINAEGGAEALKVLNRDNNGGVDLVILDIMMPEIDGITVLKELRKKQSAIELPVIMATAKDQSGDVVEALEAGANDYLTKPIDLPVLLCRVRTQLDLKNSHAGLRDSHRSLVRAAKMESVALLAAGVAHEIRNPLAQIQMGLSGLEGAIAGGNNDVVPELLRIMVEAVGNADSIVAGLVSAAAEQKFKGVAGDLNQFVASTVELMAEEELAGGGVTVEMHLDEELPKPLFDGEDLRQALLNVLFNAAQVMPEGGKIIVITREEVATDIPPDEGARSGERLRNGDQTAVIEITDEGPGASEDILTRIFDPFFTNRATGKGTGLGMTVVKKIIDLHGGVVRVRNREDRSGLSVKLMLRIKRFSII